MRGSEAARALNATITSRLALDCDAARELPSGMGDLSSASRGDRRRSKRGRVGRPASSLRASRRFTIACFDCGSADVPCSAPTRRDAPQREYKSQTHCGADRAAIAPASGATTGASRRAQAGAQLPADTQDARTGTAGVYSNSTAIATKTNTPLINIPQSVSVLTKSFIQDHGVQNLNELTRYVPGIAIHQGEGNRDELVIRGVDSSANFFVNGFRDDVQIFRDLYNTQSIEILKGPSALTFGRGAGGGLVNRTLKEADWSALKEGMLQTGSYYDRRAAIDIDQPVNENVASA
jgi:catecholate siderophore receptor